MYSLVADFIATSPSSAYAVVSCSNFKPQILSSYNEWYQLHKLKFKKQFVGPQYIVIYKNKINNTYYLNVDSGVSSVRYDPRYAINTKNNEGMVIPLDQKAAKMLLISAKNNSTCSGGGAGCGYSSTVRANNVDYRVSGYIYGTVAKNISGINYIHIDALSITSDRAHTKELLYCLLPK
jgi:hypothetical protein